MACVMFLKEDSELVLLLINTIVRDLLSPNALENNMALMTAAYLIPKEMLGMIISNVLEKTSHSKDFVRKKALICLEQIAIKDPSTYNDIVLETVTVSLSDKDPGVAIVAVQVLNKLNLENLEDTSTVIQSVIGIQEQILAHKLPKEYNFHGTSAPWAQMEILKLLEVICGKLDTEECDRVVGLVVNTLEQSFPSDASVGQAVIFSCIKTMAKALKTSSQYYHKVCKRMSKYLNSLLQSDHKNNVYIGLCAFEILLDSQAQINIGETERNLILQGLDDPDASIRRKSFSLLNSMANAENAQEICEKIVAQQKSVSSDEAFKALLVEKAIEIIDAFETETPLDRRTFVLLRLLQGASENQKSHIMFKLQNLFKNKPYTEEQLGIGCKLIKVLSSPANEPDAPETLLELYIWASAQFSTCAKKSCQQIVKIVQSSGFKEHVCSVALRHLFSIVSSASNQLPVQSLREFFAEAKACTIAPTIQDAIHELDVILAILEKTGLGYSTININDFTCSYLDSVVVRALEQGASTYDSEHGFRKETFLSAKSQSVPKSLRITPYNVMSESDLHLSMSRTKNPSSSSSYSAGAHAPEVWTLKGRNSSLNDQSPIETSADLKSTNLTTNLSKQSFEESMIEHLNQWK